MTRFQVLAPGLVDTILRRNNAQMLADDHAPMTCLTSGDPVMR